MFDPAVILPLQVSMLSGELLSHLVLTALAVRQSRKKDEQHLRPLQVHANFEDHMQHGMHMLVVFACMNSMARQASRLMVSI